MKFIGMAAMAALIGTSLLTPATAETGSSQPTAWQQFAAKAKVRKTGGGGNGFITCSAWVAKCGGSGCNDPSRLVSASCSRHGGA